MQVLYYVVVYQAVDLYAIIINSITLITFNNMTSARDYHVTVAD